MANPIREWVVALSYAVDYASQAKFLQSAKQATQTVNQEAAKQAEIAKRNEAERIAGAMRVNARTMGALWDRIGLALNAFTPEECSNYFRHAGYAPS